MYKKTPLKNFSSTLFQPFWIIFGQKYPPKKSSNPLLQGSKSLHFHYRRPWQWVNHPVRNLQISPNLHGGLAKSTRFVPKQRRLNGWVSIFFGKFRKCQKKNTCKKTGKLVSWNKNTISCFFGIVSWCWVKLMLKIPSGWNLLNVSSDSDSYSAAIDRVIVLNSYYGKNPSNNFL